MFENGFDLVDTPKRKHKPERRKVARQWMGYDEYEQDFEAIKPRKSKRFGDDDEHHDQRDAKRDFRKSARRKEKWAFDERDY